MPLELEKCERILRAFTVEGIPQKEEKEEEVRDGKGGWVRKKRKVLKKIVSCVGLRTGMMSLTRS